MEGEYIKGQKVVRWLDILMILAAAPRGLKASELATTTGMSKRTLERDLVQIEAMRQLKLEKSGPRWKLMEGATLRPVAFEHGEAVELLMACRLAVRHADYNDAVLGRALAKLDGVMPAGAALVRRFIAETAGELGAKARADDRATHLDRLVHAWIGSRKARIRYRDAQGRESVRVVHAYYLEPGSAYGHGIHLVARDELRQQMRSFRLERILDVQVLDGQYRLPPDFSLAEHLRHSWGIWSADKLEDIVLRFRAEVASRVEETAWHPSQKLRRLRDGRLEVSFRLRGTREVEPWVLGWGDDVEVIGPPALRHDVARRATAMAALYEPGEQRENAPT